MHTETNVLSPSKTRTTTPFPSTNSHKQNKGNTVSKSRHVLSPQAERGSIENRWRYSYTEKDGLGDAMGVSKLHNASKRDQSGMKTMQPGSNTPKATEKIQSTPCFSGFSFSFKRGIMSELHERL